MSETQKFDVAVLGGGPGGYASALRAALRGASTCCIEANLLGGTCLNVGCIPTKAMLHAAGLFRRIADASQFGILSGPPQVDDPAFMQRAGKVAAKLRKGLAGLLTARKVAVIRGRGSLAAADTVVVETASGTRQIKAGAIVIATGSRPSDPPFLPQNSERIWTTNQATTAETLPESILVLGGGVIGCEFATIYAELGIPVTVVEMLDSLVAGMDADASRAVARSLIKCGVKVITGAEVGSVSQTNAGVVAELGDGRTVRAAYALAALGRMPNIENIGIEQLGIEMAEGVIRVDDRCRTNVENIFAVGDVAERRQYAHLAMRMGVVAADNATGHDASDARDVVPVGVYTHPELAAVGLSEAEARSRYGKVRVGRFSLAASGIARAYGQADGLVKLIADNEGRIVGGLIVGPRATDLIQQIALAIRCRLTLGDLAGTIHPHPTFTEAVGEAALSAEGLPMHALR